MATAGHLVHSFKSTAFCFQHPCRLPYLAGVFHVRCKSKAARKIEVSDVGPDGKPLPKPNPQKLFPRLYKILLVNPDGSTYTIRQSFPHKVLTLPLDLSTLSEEEKQRMLKKRRQQQAPVYEERDDADLEFSQSDYQNLIDR